MDHGGFKFQWHGSGVWWVQVQMARQLPVSDGEPCSETRVCVQVGYDGCQPREGTFALHPHYTQIQNL